MIVTSFSCDPGPDVSPRQHAKSMLPQKKKRLRAAMHRRIVSLETVEIVPVQFRMQCEKHSELLRIDCCLLLFKSSLLLPSLFTGAVGQRF